MAQKKKKRTNTAPVTEKKTDKIWTMLPAIFTGMLLLLFLLSTVGDGLWLSLIGLRTWVVAAMVAALGWVFVDELHKGLKGTDNQNLSKGQKIRDWIKIALCVVCVVCFVSVKNAGGKPIDEYDGKPPFATMSGFASGEVSGFQKTVIGKGINCFKEWSDIAAPRNIEWDEMGNVISSDGTYGGSYKVSYHEAASVGIAESVAGEYYRKDSHKPDFEQYDDVEDIDADYANVYTTDSLSTTVLIRKDNVVVRAEFRQSGGSAIAATDIARTVANSIG